MTERYYFQHPDTGFPMVLHHGTDNGAGLIVTPCESDEGEGHNEHAEGEARRMTYALTRARILDIHEAAKYLRREFACADILF